jgi:hypothetical protein
MLIEKSNDLIGNGTSGLPACSDICILKCLLHHLVDLHTQCANDTEDTVFLGLLVLLIKNADTVLFVFNALKGKFLQRVRLNDYYRNVNI